MTHINRKSEEFSCFGKDPYHWITNTDPDPDPNLLFSGFQDALKGLSYEIDFENVDENWQILALTRAAAGFWIFQRHLWFLVEIKHFLSGKC